MKASTPQTHLEIACHTWKRMQSLLACQEIELNGTNLDISSVVAVACHNCVPKLSKDPSVRDLIEASVCVLNDHLEKNYCAYGVNTGFGGSADARTNQVVALQSALLQLTQAGVLVSSDKGNGQQSLDSHAMPAPWVRAAMVVRGNSNARGHSAVRASIVESILHLVERQITPVVPLRGSISASGDLMPLSYIAGAIGGSPDVFVQVDNPEGSSVMSARDALSSKGIDFQSLGPKEGLGLINGTSFSAALSSLVMYEAHHLAVLVQALSAMTVEALTGNAESFHPFISAIRPHDGQVECASNVLGLLQGSHLAHGIRSQKDRNADGLVQDRYSLRTVPQWIGPQLEDLMLAHRQVTVELNSSCDNPLIDPTTEEIFSGGNFQAVSITSAMEKTRSCLQMFGRLLFSQASEMIDPNMNNGLPTNLVADDPSLSFTMKGVDISMAAYMAELAYIANPVSSHVQPAEMHNQAVNSMALVSGRYTMQAVEILSLMCACSLYICCQALDLRVLHLTFLENLKPEVQKLTSEIFKDYVSEEEAMHLNKSLDTHMAKHWATTTRLDIEDRCESVVKNALPILMDTFTERSSTPSLADLNKWKSRATSLVKQIYHETSERFFNHQHTESVLGAGSKILYQTARQDLGVPFHQGFIEHPTAEDDKLNGRAKKTVGSWISIIYEAIRDGRLMNPLMATLSKSPVGGSSELNGNGESRCATCCGNGVSNGVH